MTAPQQLPWRLGAGAAAKDGAMCTIWEYDPTETPDEAGRRHSDRLVGALPRQDAERVVKCVELDMYPQRFVPGGPR